MSIDLTQSEADQLIMMPKGRIADDVQVFPSPGGKLVVELESIDRTEDFLLDVTGLELICCESTFKIVPELLSFSGAWI